MFKKQVFIKSGVVGMAAIVFVLVLMAGCGGEEDKVVKVPDVLRVAILNNEELHYDMSAFSKAVDAFAEKDAGLEASCSIFDLSDEMSPKALKKVLAKNDVVIFPSTFNKALLSQRDSFLPIESPSGDYLPMIAGAYATSDETKNWALPLVIDPMVMVQKRIGQNKPQASWSAMRSFWKIHSLKSSNPMPAMVLTLNKPLSLADQVATRLFGFGLEKYKLRTMPLEDGMTEVEVSETLGRGMRSWRHLFGDNLESIKKLPSVKDLKAFVESGYFITMALYSDVEKLPKPMKEQVFVLPIPASYGAIAPTYVWAMARTVNASYPKHADKLMHSLGEANVTLAKQLSCLPAKVSAHASSANPYGVKTLFVVRQDGTRLGHKTVIDSINADLSFSDFYKIWSESFNIPESQP